MTQKASRWTLPVVGLGALLAGGALGAFVVPGGPSVRLADDSADVEFVRDMAAHHAQAVEMSVVMLKRASDPAVKLLAQDIALTQQGQIGQLSGWLTAWGLPVAGPKPPMHGMDRAAMGMATPADVQALDTLPVRVAEGRYLVLMRRHHLGGVTMAQAALKGARQPLVRAFANRVVASQTAEVRSIDAMLRARDLTPPGPDNIHTEDMDHG
ncbi:DUF305 domain-containing protein [Deinococcus enclensis]|uniref:Uncharacterized protein (DUF305 family) n=1 Tax=Deinococcus enclensis TaxID=1049582 RepID=A0ABT9MG06_9DEIO|nr:DUF305 domain-containing protein [Deinococcus enclensis]MDP9765522.1 uncharacterized protein (DUF305 family) [Deinococcus enclensis]